MFFWGVGVGGVRVGGCGVEVFWFEVRGVLVGGWRSFGVRLGGCWLEVLACGKRPEVERWGLLV